MGSWSLDLNKYADKCKKNLNDVKKEVAFSLYSSIVKKTPVDTGRARGNWHISVGQESFETFGTETKVSDKQKVKGKKGNSEGAKVVSTSALIVGGKEQIENSGDKPIFIQNNLPYIVALEYGHSKQAPNGMVGVTVANMKKYVDNAIAGVTK